MTIKQFFKNFPDFFKILFYPSVFDFYLSLSSFFLLHHHQLIYPAYSSQLTISMNENSEKRDFVRVVEDLEDQQRHDLSVHLYLAYLLHQVNPYFPHTRWASWPVRLPKVADPDLRGGYEDIAVDNLFRNLQDGIDWATKIDIKSDSVQSAPESPKSNEQVIDFQRSSGRLELTHKRLRKSNPKAAVVNEMYAALHRVIYKKANRLAKQGQRVNLKETGFTKKMALRLANRLGNVLSTLENQGRRRGFFPKTWQDVLIANLQMSGLGEVCDIDSHKLAYMKAKKLFMDYNHKYEYDADTYGEFEGSNKIPEFDVEHHLATIEKEGIVKYSAKRPPLERLEAMRQERATKDHVFWTLLRNKMTARQLSWKDWDVLSDFEVTEGEYQEERQKEFTNHASTLSPNSFKVDGA